MALYQIVYAILIATVLGPSSDRAPGSLRVLQSRVEDTCSVQMLARAAAVDTSRLRRVNVAQAPDKSAEGGETTFYYQGDEPRVVVITFYGETGRTVVRYYLAARDKYVAEQEVITYAEPISVRSRPVIIARQPSVLYVCGESRKDPLNRDELEAIGSDLRSVLNTVGGKH